MNILLYQNSIFQRLKFVTNLQMSLMRYLSINNLQDKIESYAKFYIFSINSFALSEVNWDSNISSVFENYKVNAKAY